MAAKNLKDIWEQAILAQTIGKKAKEIADLVSCQDVGGLVAILYLLLGQENAVLQTEGVLISARHAGIKSPCQVIGGIIGLPDFPVTDCPDWAELVEVIGRVYHDQDIMNLQGLEACYQQYHSKRQAGGQRAASA